MHLVSRQLRKTVSLLPLGSSSSNICLFYRKAFIDVNADDKGKVLILDQSEFNGYTISVAEDQKRQTSGGGNDRDQRTLFAKNLPYSADEHSISQLFEGVREVRLLRDRDSGRAKG